jgi:hypothetical protein
MNFEGDGDDLGDATDDGTVVKKSLFKVKDARARAKTIPQKQDEQDALGTPDVRTLSAPYRRPVGNAKPDSARGAGHIKKKGKNHR